jgi:hypothetical protein
LITATILFATSIGIFIKRRFRDNIKVWQNYAKFRSILRENKNLKALNQTLQSDLELMEAKKNSFYGYTIFLERKYCIRPGDARTCRAEFLIAVRGNQKTDQPKDDSEIIADMA